VLARLVHGHPTGNRVRYLTGTGTEGSLHPFQRRAAYGFAASDRLNRVVAESSLPHQCTYSPFGYFSPEGCVGNHHVAGRPVLQHCEIQHAHVFALLPTAVCLFPDRDNLARSN